ncbi:dna repair protein rhp55 [Fusarium langsethiae]|uniref:Dna repair protein rhp55 n=1 Tax=Fusarium langsethiae TaxID=179993 RepID=A0A0N0V754_FUSLA|nr:dna repair protein rhp55 [Fusarium langsethiae]
MDYHAIHGYDRASFDTPSTHRLPTVSASQALDDLGCDASTHLSTGLEGLDRSLLGPVTVDSQDAAVKGGVQRGQVTEIWGPPGSGKTALGLQLTANALCDGDTVVWIDCFQALQRDRLRTVTKAVQARQNGSSPTEVEAAPAREIDASQFYQYSCFTLPHLISLVSRPTTKLIPTSTSLVILSSFSALVNSALPKSNNDGKSISKGSKGMSRFQRVRWCWLTFVQALVH